MNRRKFFAKAMAVSAVPVVAPMIKPEAVPELESAYKLAPSPSFVGYVWYPVVHGIVQPGEWITVTNSSSNAITYVESADE